MIPKIPGEPYSIFWGNMAYNVVGVFLALMWVVFFLNRIPGNWVVKGIIYSIILSVIAGLVVSPLAMLAAGDTVGIFYYDTWFPGRIILAGLILHLSYEIVLLMCLNITGINEHVTVKSSG